MSFFDWNTEAIRHKYNLQSLPKVLFYILIDGLLIAIATAIAILFRFESGISGAAKVQNFFSYYPWHVGIFLLAFLLGGVYRILWKYGGLRDLVRLAFCAFLGGMTFFTINKVFVMGLSGAVTANATIFTVVLVGAVRLWGRKITKGPAETARIRLRKSERKRAMVFGAGSGGAYAITLSRQDSHSFFLPVLAIDDNPYKQGLYLHNVPILGTRQDIPALVAAHDIQEIILAVAPSRIEDMEGLLQICKQTDCRIRILSEIQALDKPTLNPKLWLRDVNISDFLMRGEERFDHTAISAYLKGKTVMVTGGGGSIGSELCRQVMRFSPKQLIIFDIYENNAYELFCELQQNYANIAHVEVLIGSIRDKGRLQEVLGRYKPEVVLHAAAHKHVPLMETSYGEAVKNNVFGTRNLLEACEESGVLRFVMLSTDKAVNPTNIMGATKRINEMMVRNFSRTSQMKCMMVRFGNVLGSHGSVIPLFESQIKKGGPVTVTHPDIVRYFMTIPEAAQLVLQAGAFAENGAIYTLDMGRPVKIVDLAEKIIRFHGYTPNLDMAIQYTGLRPGEKLYEELLYKDEQSNLIGTLHKKIFVVPTLDVDSAWFNAQLETLEQAVFAGGESEERKEAVQRLIKQIVPEYKSDAINGLPKGNIAMPGALTDECREKDKASPLKDFPG